MSAPFTPLNTGDTTDDDGTVIDSLFIETDRPPDPLIEPFPDLVPIEEPAKTRRLLSGNRTLLTTWDPILLLPPDIRRKDFYARVTSPTAVATDFVWLCDESGKIATTDCGKLFHTQDINLGLHTGPLYVSCVGSSAPMVVSYWSTTS